MKAVLIAVALVASACGGTPTASCNPPNGFYTPAGGGPTISCGAYTCFFDTHGAPTCFGDCGPCLGLPGGGTPPFQSQCSTGHTCTKECGNANGAGWTVFCRQPGMSIAQDVDLVFIETYLEKRRQKA